MQHQAYQQLSKFSNKRNQWGDSPSDHGMRMNEAELTNEFMFINLRLSTRGLHVIIESKAKICREDNGSVMVETDQLSAASLSLIQETSFLYLLIPTGELSNIGSHDFHMNLK